MPPVVAVIGAGECDESVRGLAHEVGRRLAERGCIVVTGGLGGVMEAASRGAKEAGGLVIGIVPGASRGDANRWVDVAVATGMGDARNAIIANTADAFIAVSGSLGTLSEIAFARKRGKPVASLESFELVSGVMPANDPAHAVEIVLAAIEVA